MRNSITLFLTLILLGVSTAYAQRGPSPVDVFNANRERERREDEYRRSLDHIKEGDRKPPVTDPRRKQALVEQIKEDFNLIQVLNNEMIRAAFSDQALNFETLSDKAADIKKRATRLKATIRLPPPKEEKKSLEDQERDGLEQLKASLLLLRKSIGGFVNNPFFQHPGVVDVQQSAQASRDLQVIIELSDAIRKSAKKLDKGSK